MQRRIVGASFAAMPQTAWHIVIATAPITVVRAMQCWFVAGLVELKK